jgi:hypothetical protein
MKPRLVLVSLFLSIATAGFASAQSQQPAAVTPSPTPSLGELARHLKAQREKAAVKPQTVFTNDNLPARPPQEGPTAAGGMAPAGGEKPKAEAGAPSGGPSPEAHDEKYYREKMKDLQSQMDVHQRELAVLEQKTGQAQVQFYTDPNKTLQQSSTPAFYSDVNKLRDEIEKKKQQIADDQKAIEDLRDQLRREGGAPGWLR